MKKKINRNVVIMIMIAVMIRITMTRVIIITQVTMIIPSLIPSSCPFSSQDPYNNIVRTTVEGMAAVMGKYWNSTYN